MKEIQLIILDKTSSNNKKDKSNITISTIRVRKSYNEETGWSNQGILKRFHLPNPRGVVVKAMNCRIGVSEFELHLRYYVHFRTNILEKSMNPS